MGPRWSWTLKTAAQFLLVSTAGFSLVACQKARMSSSNRQEPVAQPRPMPPGVIPPGSLPPGVVPPGRVPPGLPPTGLPPRGQPPVGTVPPIMNPPPPMIPPTATPPYFPPQRTPPAPTPTTPPPVVTSPPTTLPPATQPPVTQAPPVAQPLPPGPPTVVVAPPVTSGPTPVVVAPPPTPVVVVPSTPAPQPTTVIVNGSAPAGRNTDISRIRIVSPPSIYEIPTCPTCAPAKQALLTPSECRPGDKCQIETILNVENDPLTCPAIELRPRSLDKVDILLVVDTSASMKQERAEIARQIKNFVAQLDDGIDYTVGIIIAHGPHSVTRTEKLGGLYEGRNVGGSTGSALFTSIAFERGRSYLIEKSNPQISREELKKRARAEAAAEIGEYLAQRILELPDERTANKGEGAQGEAGLLNLYTAMTDNQHLLKQAGTLRDGAGLVIFTISDENDICFDYEAAKARGEKITRRSATAKDLKVETDAFNDARTCARVVNGSERLTADAVLKAIKTVKRDDPVIISGVHYLSESSLPAATDKYKGDNEAGHGYLHLIGLNHSVSADLAGANFGEKMVQLGRFSDFRLKYDVIFPMILENGVQPEDVDPEKVRVTIIEGSGKTHVFSPRRVGKDGRIEQVITLEILPPAEGRRHRAQVVIRNEVLAEVVEGGKIGNDARVIIAYNTKSGEAERRRREERARQAAPVVAQAPAVTGNGAGDASITTAPAVTSAQPTRNANEREADNFFEKLITGLIGSYEQCDTDTNVYGEQEKKNCKTVVPKGQLGLSPDQRKEERRKEWREMEKKREQEERERQLYGGN